MDAAMAEPADSGAAPAPRGPLAVKLGPLFLQGPVAIAALVVLLALIVAGLIWVRPTLRMLVSGVLWVVFLIYWSVAAANKAPTVKTESVASRAVHTRLLNLSLMLLYIPVPGLRARFAPLNVWIVGAGLAVQASGFLLAVWARRHLGRNWSGAVSIAADHQLIRTGPYRLVRHPIYTAMFLMSAGVCLVSGEAHALGGLAVLAVAYARKIPQEEGALREQFGAAFEDYRASTWALIPWVA
jgi:protein-S-isoprenylcysteine O-methyltransferase Ste14